MKTLFKILRILLMLAFAGAFVILTISIIGIKEHQMQVEDIIQKDVSYYSDETYYFGDYYKYKDADGIEYWVSKQTNKLDYVYNPAAQNINTSVSLKKAEDIAIETAQQHNKNFFKSDFTVELKADTYYEFYIFELDQTGYKSGRFIVVKVSGSTFEYVSMHTDKVTDNPNLGMCISESQAINTAYSASSDSEFMLKIEDNHLLNTGFYNDSDIWIWEVKIYRITQDEIVSLTQPIVPNNYFLVQIDAVTGEIIFSEWIQEATDYCPLDGSIF